MEKVKLYLYPNQKWDKTTFTTRRWWPTYNGSHGSEQVFTDCVPMIATDDGYHSKAFMARLLTDDELGVAALTAENSNALARHIQGALNRKLGYRGPVKPGEARALARLFGDLGRTDLVRRGYLLVKWTTPGKWAGVAWRSHKGYGASYDQMVTLHKRLKHCYMFKSPLPTVPFGKFINLVRLYRGDHKGLRDAVMAILANPDFAASEVQTIDALDVLSNLGKGK